MKKLLAVTALAVLCVPVYVLAAEATATQPAAKQFAVATQTQPSEFKSEIDKVSYAIGLNIAKGMKQQIPDVNGELLAKGLKDGLGGTPKLAEQDVMQTLMTYAQTMRAKQQEQAAKAGLENKEKGEAFLAKNAKEEGVKVTPTGLQYKVIKEGTGPKPKATDTVEVKYRGTLVDGTEFDSSKDQTVSFPINGVIKGWTEALQLMPVGSKWQVVIPSDLAYGERQAGPQIGPNATLVFDVELVSIKAPATQAAPKTPAPKTAAPKAVE
jgi:FKBP-type peptidyl-prolyl cis-trans isomerase FklB